MNRTPEQQWSALSALYEEADGLRADELPTWMEQLEREGNPLLPQLKLMLQARSHLETNDFLGTLPKLSSDATHASDWHEGDRVGPYRLVKPLGEGGMAEVWLADRADGAFKRQVAIKLPYPRPGRETFAARFDRERDILATLRHPHIAGLFDAGVTKDGQAWLALEYVEGQSISTFCDERKLPLRERVQLFRQVLLAVQHAHANLVIHRDLKPGNILVTVQGEVRLLDFGIAKLLEAQGNAIEETELTRQAGRSMTPRYASPEQLMGLPLTTACDVYSLGVVFYELICGERPYELKVESAAQLEHSILEVEPRAPSRRSLNEEQASFRGTRLRGLRKVLAPELDAIALRCLEKKPSARYSSVDAILGDVDRWLAGEAVLARAPGAWYRFAKFANRHRIGVGLGAASIVALAGIATVAVVLGLQAREESARAGASRDFMLGLFKRADQEKARGADITARELLESGRKDVLTRLEFQPLLQAELLLGIATIQKDMGEYLGADSTYANASDVYRRLGMWREATMARAAEADANVRLGNFKRAESVLQEAKNVSVKVGDNAEVKARLAEVEGWIAFSRNDSPRARALFAESHDQALRAFGPYHPKTMDALRGQIYTERQVRNFGEALKMMSSLQLAVENTPGLDATDWAAVARDRGDLFLAAGRVQDALVVLAPALPKCVEGLGINHKMCRELAYSRASVHLQLGLVSQAKEDFQNLEAIANDRTSPALAMGTIVLMVRIMAGSAADEKHGQWFDRLKSLVESDSSGMSQSLRMKAISALAEARMRRKDPIEGERWIRKVLAMLKREDGAVPPSRAGAVAKSLLGICLAQQGDQRQSLEALSAAQRDFAQLFGQNDLTTNLFSINQAIALESFGRVSEASTLVDKALPVILKGMGSSSPAYLRVKVMHDRLHNARAGEAMIERGKGTARTDEGVRARISMDFFS